MSNKQQTRIEYNQAEIEKQMEVYFELVRGKSNHPARLRVEKALALSNEVIDKALINELAEILKAINELKKEN
jgi:hypothetical protein